MSMDFRDGLLLHVELNPASMHAQRMHQERDLGPGEALLLYHLGNEVEIYESGGIHCRLVHSW